MPIPTIVCFLAMIAPLLPLSDGKKEVCPNIVVRKTIGVELGTSYELKDSAAIDGEDIKAVAAHLPNETAKTIAKCQNKNGEYNCSKNQEDMYAVKIDDLSMIVKSFSSASGILYTNTSLIIYNASEGQPAKFCFVYEFIRNGNFEYQSTAFTVHFTHMGFYTPQPTKGRERSATKSSSGLVIALAVCAVLVLVIVAVPLGIHCWRHRSVQNGAVQRGQGLDDQSIVEGVGRSGHNPRGNHFYSGSVQRYSNGESVVTI